MHTAMIASAMPSTVTVMSASHLFTVGVIRLVDDDLQERKRLALVDRGQDAPRVAVQERMDERLRVLRNEFHLCGVHGVPVVIGGMIV